MKRKPKPLTDKEQERKAIHQALKKACAKRLDVKDPKAFSKWMDENVIIVT